MKRHYVFMLKVGNPDGKVPLKMISSASLVSKEPLTRENFLEHYQLENWDILRCVALGEPLWVSILKVYDNLETAHKREAGLKRHWEVDRKKSFVKTRKSFQEKVEEQAKLMFDTLTEEEHDIVKKWKAEQDKEDVQKALRALKNKGTFKVSGVEEENHQTYEEKIQDQLRYLNENIGAQA